MRLAHGRRDDCRQRFTFKVGPPPTIGALEAPIDGGDVAFIVDTDGREFLLAEDFIDRNIFIFEHNLVRESHLYHLQGWLPIVGMYQKVDKRIRHGGII